MSVKFSDILYWVFLFAETLFVTSQLFEGDECRIERSNEIGQCQLLNDCRPALEALVRRSGFPQTCSFRNSVPVVCCPLISATSSVGEISDKKCQEYGKSVFREVKAPVLKLTRNYVNQSLCAIRAKNFIVGGEKAEPKEFPHMAILGYDGSDGIEWGCGGSLISSRFVITAAHCLSFQQFMTVKYVRLGILNLKELNRNAKVQTFDIINTYQHPEYKPPSLYNDIALLKLDRNAVFDEYVRPICLQVESDIPHENAIATGWGRVGNFREASDDLLKVTLDLYSMENCKKKFEIGVSKRKLRQGIRNESQICAGSVNEHKDTCQGDSGGPLQVYNEKVYCMYKLIGITSFGKACGGFDSPGVYTRVSNYIPWIENIVWNDSMLV